MVFNSKIHYKFFAFVLVYLLLAGCSSGDDEVAAAGVSNDGVPSTMSKRPSSISYDWERDGTVNLVWRFNYDDKGRIVSREIEDLDDPSNNATVNFEYKDGKLIRKVLDGTVRDEHTYADDKLVSSKRHWDGEHTYAYDAAGKLISSTGEDYFYDDDCIRVFSEQSNPFATPEFDITYNEMGRFVSAVTNDNSYSLSFTYKADGLISRMVQGCGSDDSSPLHFQYTYGNANRIEKFEIINYRDLQAGDINSVDTTEFEYDAGGRIIRSISSEGFAESEIETTEFSYSDDGMLIGQDLTIANRDPSAFFSIPDQSISIIYEDKPCVAALSSNPATLLVANSIRNSLVNTIALPCTYPLDDAEF